MKSQMEILAIALRLRLNSFRLIMGLRLMAKLVQQPKRSLELNINTKPVALQTLLALLGSMEQNLGPSMS
jgi:hypothetical protein